MTSRPPRLAPADAAPDTSPDARKRSGPRVRDTLAILVVPVALFAVFLLPAPLKDSFVFSDPGSPAAVVLAHFVHRTPAHLLGNVGAYLLVVPGAYYLSALAGRRSDFYVAFGVYLFAFPVVLSVLSRPFVEHGAVFGFSGILLAFVGFLPLAIARYLEDRLDGMDLDDAPGLFFLGTALIAYRGIPDSALAITLAGLAVLAATLYLLPAAFRSDFGSLRRMEGLDLVVGTAAVLVLVLLAAFPADPVSGSTVVNLYVHLLGYGLGFVPSYLAFRLAPAIEERSWIVANSAGA